MMMTKRWEDPQCRVHHRIMPHALSSPKVGLDTFFLSNLVKRRKLQLSRDPWQFLTTMPQLWKNWSMAPLYVRETNALPAAFKFDLIKKQNKNKNKNRWSPEEDERARDSNTVQWIWRECNTRADFWEWCRFRQWWCECYADVTRFGDPSAFLCLGAQV